MNIKVDKLPDGCNSSTKGCIFNRWRCCILKMALGQDDSFVHNNREIVPEDCPLRK